MKTSGLLLLVALALAGESFFVQPVEERIDAELVFPLEHWHNHASMVVEAPNGDLLVCWFHGSGERTADDVVDSRRAAEEGREGLERAVPARRHARLSRHQRDDVHRSAAAAVAAVADDSRQRVAHGADEVQDLVGLPARRPAAVGRRARCCTSRPATSSRRRSIASWIGCAATGAARRAARAAVRRQAADATPATS